MVGIAWVAVCWGVMVCIRVGHAVGGDSFPSDLSNCTLSHPKHGIFIFLASKNVVYNIFQSAGLCCCVVGRVVLSISKDYSVVVFRVRQAKNSSCSLLLQHSCRAG